MGYIHPTDQAILAFGREMSRDGVDLPSICRNLLRWFEEHAAYSRLNAPFFPLQRSDLDVLTMQAGTCGDYANLIVSVLSALNFDARYAYVHRDCYGDRQDHICAAAKAGGSYMLIDATLPYRKWHGFACPHQEFDLLSAQEFEKKMKAEEAYWSLAAQRHHNKMLAGLLYAPWIHAECMNSSNIRLDQAFFLLSFDKGLVPTLYVYAQRYTAWESSIPVMAVIQDGKTSFHFSVHPHEGLWDPRQWGPGYGEGEIPQEYSSKELQLLQFSIAKVQDQVAEILCQIGCSWRNVRCKGGMDAGKDAVFL